MPPPPSENLRSGQRERLPYSLSRYTDIPASLDKWQWWCNALHQGYMQGFDPRTATPSWWSLAPEDTLSLEFWTKNPERLIQTEESLRPYSSLHVHVTLTGWAEVEHGAPCLEEGIALLRRTIATFGECAVSWRFSPVPLLEEGVVTERFAQILDGLMPHVPRVVYVGFLQENLSTLKETRTVEERARLLWGLARLGRVAGCKVLVCSDLATWTPLLNPHPNLTHGVCVPTTRYPFSVETEECGCALMADPFTMNESCQLACVFCYVVTTRKHNTTRLPLL